MEYQPYIDYALWGLGLLVLLVALLVIWRWLNQRVRGRRGQRLGINEYQELDQSRRLVLVRRDNVEHLLLIGGPNDLVVESHIAAAGASFQLPASDLTAEAALRPVVAAFREAVGRTMEN